MDLTLVVLKSTVTFTGSYSMVHCDIHAALDTVASSKFKAISIIKLTLTSAIFIWHDSLWLNGSPLPFLYKANIPQSINNYLIIPQAKLPIILNFTNIKGNCYI